MNWLLVKMWFQSFFVCISFTVVKSWTLPSRDFLSEFAIEHDRTSIIFYLPQKIPVQKWIKNDFCSGSYKNIQVSFVIPSLLANASQELLTFKNEDLHIFVPDDQDKKSMENSIQLFMQIYGLRSNSRREHWLLDISYWIDSQEASKNLFELPSDLDDDLYWYKYLDWHPSAPALNFINGNHFDIDLFEVYKINKDMNLTVNYYGNWSKAVGIKLAQEKKWSRRKNLKVG